MNNHDRSKLGFKLCMLLLLFIGQLVPNLLYANDENDKPNVLLIAVDDLRPELGCYGAGHIHSPNIDRFSKSAVVFSRAYCQQSVCNPSRTSLMTGMRPDTIGVTGNHIHFRSNKPSVVTLPQHFKNHGYHAVAIGKIYHGVFPEGSSNTKWDTMGDPESWSEPAVRFGPRYYYTEAGMVAARQVYQRIYKPKNPGPDDWTQKLVFGPATESPDVPDSTLYDGKVADAAVEKLGQLKKQGKPFFLAVGFIKPHSPYIAPKKYFDLYQNVGVATDQSLPKHSPTFAGHGSNELRRYTDQPRKGPIAESQQQRVRHAYYACTSFIDAQIGKVLDELDRLKLTENTIVCLYGDHGYHLGEQGLWGKTTNFELDSRVPLIVRVPGMKGAGQASFSLVELVDIYPTLADLANLPIHDELEGRSFSSILDDASLETKDYALSQYPRGGGLMGYSMRTKTHRLTQWVDRKSGAIKATELYEYDGSFVEKENVASDKKNASLLDNLKKKLESVFEINARPTRPMNDKSDERPNILLIVSEDNGPELGCYGDKYAQTPNLDRLAGAGIRFQTAYVTQSVCSPSRGTILTGLYPHQNGQIGLATHQFAMFQEWPTTYSILKQAGYRTGMLGKLHVNPPDAIEKWIDFRAIKSSNFAKKNLGAYSSKAAEFFNDSKKPFFLTVNFPDAHWPVQNEVEDRPRSLLTPKDVRPMDYIHFDNPRMRGHIQGYYNCMSRLDECVGELLAELDKSGKADNTIVIYIGDHGAQFSRGKVFVTEGGLRIPFIVRWPGKAKAGHVSSQMVSTIDLLPTIVKAAGCQIPTNIPGIDLARVFDGNEKSIRKYLFGERNTDAAILHYPQRAIRDSRYKLIKTMLPDRPDPAVEKYLINGASNFRGSPTRKELEQADSATQRIYRQWLNPPEYQLFDLEKDPNEFVNLAEDAAMNDIKQRLITRLEKWQIETNDELRHSELLDKLTNEIDDCLEKKIRVPKGGWKYQKYLNPNNKLQKSKAQQPEKSDLSDKTMVA